MTSKVEELREGLILEIYAECKTWLNSTVRYSISVPKSLEPLIAAAREEGAASEREKLMTLSRPGYSVFGVADLSGTPTPTAPPAAPQAAKVWCETCLYNCFDMSKKCDCCWGPVIRQCPFCPTCVGGK